MKKIILALATLLFMGSAATKAQVTKVTVRSISGNSKEEVENIDNAKYRITYEGKWVNNPSIKPFIYTDSEMRLDIGEKATSFYDRTKQVKDSLMDEKAKTGNFDFSDLPKGGRFPFSYYKNYPSTGKSIQLESVGTTDYKCTENVETPNWQLIPDSTTTIIGYHCQLAKTNFKGRIWLAWYAEDIPVPEGPWKLCGLPGLILRAYDAQQQFYLNAIGQEDLKGKETLKYAKPEKTEIVSQSDLTKIKLRDDGSEMLRDEKWTDENGKPIKPKARKRVFNPIER